jgi:hypothetical protein
LARHSASGTAIDAQAIGIKPDSPLLAKDMPCGGQIESSTYDTYIA